MMNSRSHRPATKPTQSKTNDKLLIVTDLGLFKSYRLEHTDLGTPRLELLDEIVLEEAHQRLADRISDMTGRHGTPVLSGASPMNDGKNLELEKKRRLVRLIASYIEKQRDREQCTEYWLAAHKDINQQLMDELEPATRARISRNVALNLTRSPAGELLEQFDSRK